MNRAFVRLGYVAAQAAGFGLSATKFLWPAIRVVVLVSAFWGIVSLFGWGGMLMFIVGIMVGGFVMSLDRAQAFGFTLDV